MRFSRKASWRSQIRTGAEQGLQAVQQFPQAGDREPWDRQSRKIASEVRVMAHEEVSRACEDGMLHVEEVATHRHATAKYMGVDQR
jgi:hypothetical protein